MPRSFLSEKLLKIHESNQKEFRCVESEEKVIDTLDKYIPAQVINMREEEGYHG